MTRHPTPPRYYNFVLTMWEECNQEGTASSSVWRFRLENPYTGEKKGFTNLDALLSTLKEQTQQKPSSD